MSSDSAVSSIGIPMYRAAPIGWLSLESVARQERVDFPWEVIVVEDEDDPERMGEEAVRVFEPRMRERGCVALKYEVMPGRPPLALKWRRIGQLLGPACGVFMIQGCDDYCDPLRFARTHRLFADPELDWIQSRFGMFYDIATGDLVLYDDQLKKDYEVPSGGFTRQPTGLNMAGRAAPFRSLPEEEVRRGVDQWLFRNVLDSKPSPLKVTWDEQEVDWHPAVFTQGMNTISLHRWHLMRRIEPPFAACVKALPELLPEAVSDRLQALRPLATEALIALLAGEIDAIEPKLEDFRQMKARRDEKIQKLTEKIEQLKQELARRSKAPWSRFFGGPAANA